jgi:hypothetical protein
MRSRRAPALLALLAAILVTAPAASGHNATPWFGTYQVSIVGGSQDTTWTLNHQPTSGCDVTSTGQGSDDQDFLTGGPQTVQFDGVGSTAFPATITGLALNYTESRQGSITTSAPTGANTAECPGAARWGSSSGESPPTRHFATLSRQRPPRASPHR